MSSTTTPTPNTTLNNKEDIWYTKSDYQEFRDSVKRDVLHMASMCQSNCLDNLDFSEHSVVGIEKYCCSASEQRIQKSQREQLIQAVLNQQATQKLLKMQDDDTIRLICQVYTLTPTNKSMQKFSNKANPKATQPKISQNIQYLFAFHLLVSERLPLPPQS